MSVLVLGIGNILWADEGFWLFAPSRLFIGCMPWSMGWISSMAALKGLYLVNRVTEVERLLVFDAIDYGLHPRHAEGGHRR